ncbi:hypothetical protein ACKVMT_05795 [Halobacteriales archaeon Cl-PHB]
MVGLNSSGRQVVKRVVNVAPQSLVASGLEVVRHLPFRRGTNVYDREWDVLVLLDGCRYDMYQEVVGNSAHLISVGSTSTEWMDNTFTERRAKEVADTAYVSANPYSHRLDPDRFGLLDHVWETHWDDDLGTIPADPVTDHAITVARETDHPRVIVHYMQPHFPFVASGEPAFGRLGRGGFGLGDEASQNVWHMLAAGEVDEDAVVEAFYDNLKYVYSSVERLLSNVDGTVAISADHGNAIGEWGMYGHRAYVPSMALKKVPWDIRQCTDEERDDPDVTLAEITDHRGDMTEVDDRLRALGYTE